MDTRRSDAGGQRHEAPGTLTLPDEECGAQPRDRAREAGIDAAVLDRLFAAMEPGDREEIRVLCARDLETTRLSLWRTLRCRDAHALARHLHVMVSLAQTVGADGLADEVRRMQVRLRSGATTGYTEAARRVDDLARRAARFLAEAAP